MRKIIRDVFTPTIIERLAAHNNSYLEFNNRDLTAALALVREHTDASFEYPSNVKVESRPKGHPWHLDTGTSGHMAWCRYTARVLLDHPSKFEGGGYYFKDDPQTPLFHHNDLILYDQSPENEHYVASHNGQRRVLLMFLA